MLTALLACPIVSRFAGASARPPIRVLQVLVGAAARTGGVPAFVGGASVEVEKLGVEVKLLATDLALAPWGWVQRQRRIGPDEVHPTLAKLDLELHRARFPRRLANSRGLAAALDRLTGEFDVVHIHNLWQFPQYAAYRAALAAEVPYVVSPHGGLDPYLRQRGRIRKRLTSSMWQRAMLERASLIHVTTAAEERSIADIAPAVRRAVVPCGLYVEDFAALPDSGRFRDRHLGGFRGPVILFLGRITQKKGVDVLIRAFARIGGEPDARLVIAGPDDEGILPSLRRVARESGAARRIDFPGPVYGEERREALASADVWALSSHTENFGIAVVEAMAAGRAVVISEDVNLAEDVAAADAGVVAEATPEAFAEGLRAVLADSARRRELESRAPEFAARYDWSAVGPRLRRMYERAAGR